MTGEIEASVREGREFLRRARATESPHIINRVQALANSLQQGYADVQEVRDFVEEVRGAIPQKK